MVAFIPGDRPDGTSKDTALNISSGKEFTVNLVARAQAEGMNATEFPFELREAATLGIELEAGQQLNTPRVKASLAALECREVKTVTIGRTRIILDEVLGLSRTPNDTLFTPPPLT